MPILRPATSFVVIGAVLLGCAANASDPSSDPANTPTQDQQETKSPSANGTDPPPFDANFNGSDGGSGTTPPPANPPPPSSPSGNECIDKNDAGGSETLAQKMPDTDDCDGNGGTIKGVMNGAEDVDFYSIHIKDAFLCEANPHFTTAAESLEVCVFVKCDSTGTTKIDSCGSGAPKTSDIGDPGCCFATPGTMDFGYSCSGLIDPDSATFFVKVSQPTGDKCEPYSIDYHG